MEKKKQKQFCTRSARSRFHRPEPRPKGFSRSKKPRPVCCAVANAKNSKVAKRLLSLCSKHQSDSYTMVLLECFALASIGVVVVGEIYLLKKLFSDGNFPYTHVKNSAFAIKGDFNWVMRKLLFQGRNVYDLKNLARIICAATMLKMQMGHTSWW